MAGQHPVKLQLRKDSNGFGLFEALLVILVLLVAAFGGWYVWQHDRSKSKDSASVQPTQPSNKVPTTFAECVAQKGIVQETYPEQCVVSGKSFTNPDQKAPTAPKQTYLALKEWGLRVPLIASYEDLTYVFTKNETGEYATFTFKRLADKGYCKTDIGVAVSRQKTNNQPPYDLGNPQSFKHIGDYYYYQAFGGSPCYDDTDKTQMAIVNSINGGNLKGAVTNSLESLEAIPAQ